MRKSIQIGVIVAILAVGALSVPSNISPFHQFSWGENTGWLNWREANNAADGVVVGDTFLSGYIWGENAGWINVGGGGGPYANTDDTDFGVNRDMITGELSGYAWSENLGWINFSGGALATPAEPAEFDQAARRFRGYAWSENAGWINLDDATHYVGTLAKPDLDMDGDVDGIDFLTFSNCFNGSLNPPNPGCANLGADIDGDGDVDGVDFLTFSNCFNGSLNPPNAGCP